ncbi:hypothetical protein [Candidatus Poriferisocius sp.]|uniref:hypothetical protein n=1 Tax=Candidatus Poriferisocius sp. TaxID=3101276 RepID=UPI003B016496
MLSDLLRPRRALALIIAAAVLAAVVASPASAHEGEQEAYTERVQTGTETYTEQVQTRTEVYTERVQTGTETYSEQVQTGTELYTERVQTGTRTVTKYVQTGTKQVRVGPYTRTVRHPCITVIISGQAGTYCPPPTTETVYNYREVPVWKTTQETVPVYETVTRSRPVYETVYRTRPVYETVTRTRPVYETVTRSRPVYETVTRTRTVHDDGCTSPSQPSQHSTAPANHRATSVYFDDYGHNCVLYRSAVSRGPSLGDIARSVVENVEKALETVGTTLQDAVETAVRTANRLVCSEDGQILTAAAFGTMTGVVTTPGVGFGAGVGAAYYLRETCGDLYPTAAAAPTATAEPTTEPTTEPTVQPTVAPTTEPTAAPTQHPDHQEPPPVFSRKLCRTIGTHTFCHYYTPDGWTQRTHVD